MSGEATSGVLVVGSANVDLILSVPRLTRSGETVLATGTQLLAGGKGANQAVAAARAGARTSLLAAIGHDADGDLLLAALDAAGVSTEVVLRIADVATGRAIIQVDTTGANMIVVVQGANGALAQPSVDAVIADSRADVLLTQLELPPAVVTQAHRAGRHRGMTIVLNAAPAAPPADIAEILDVDVLVVNEHEAAELVGAPSADDPEALLAPLRALGPGAVVITLGERGALSHDAETTRLHPALPTTVVDTTGAGDAFCGALAGALSAGRGFHAAIEAGLEMAARTVAVAGAQAPPDIPAR